MANQLNFRHSYDSITNQHFHRNFSVVMHCHHYFSVFIELAHAYEKQGGPRFMQEAAAETFGSFLRLYYLEDGIKDLGERIRIAEEYWRQVGMGIIRISTQDPTYGSARMNYSHIDEGWLKKGAPTSRPINYVTQGFLAGFMQAAYTGGRSRTYEVKETKSLVLGDEYSQFEATLREQEHHGN